ncbi:hypothetical protein J4558_05565 [Leptolyngbya sp. 15MV]|nr:hypothetical protein J4558_05565 [Leptolyngbya sp. 15MV]
MDRADDAGPDDPITRSGMVVDVAARTTNRSRASGMSLDCYMRLWPGMRAFIAGSRVIERNEGILTGHITNDANGRDLR